MIRTPEDELKRIRQALDDPDVHFDYRPEQIRQMQADAERLEAEIKAEQEMGS